MIIGIQMKPVKRGLPEPSVFYCGRNGAEFRKKLTELVARNTDGSRFYSVTHPLLVPLASVLHSTEDHPDIVAAQKRRAELAKAAEPDAKLETEKEIIRLPAAEGLAAETQPIIPIPGLETAGPETENTEPESVTPEARRAELAVLKHGELRAIAQDIKNAGQPIALITGTKAQLIEAILASETVTAGSDAPPPISSNP